MDIVDPIDGQRDATGAVDLADLALAVGTVATLVAG
jgi:hypothetical protein